MEKNQDQNDSEAVRLINEMQARLMIDAGISENNSADVEEWIDANAKRLRDILNEDPGLVIQYSIDPSETIIEIKRRLYQ